MDAVTSVPPPANEPVRGYAPGSAERESLARRIGELEGERHELTMTIGGVSRMAGGDSFSVVQPHDHEHALGVSAQATSADVADAVAAAKQAAPGWREEAASRLPMGKLGQPDEIADFVVFLLSERSGVVTGSVIDWDQNVLGGLD